MKYQHLIFAPFATGDAWVVGKTLAEVIVFDVVVFADNVVLADTGVFPEGVASIAGGEMICKAAKEKRTAGIRERKVTLSVSLN